MRAAALAVALVVHAASVTPNGSSPQPHSLVFTHVSVIDVTAGDSGRALRTDQTLIVVGDRISAIGKTGEVRVPRGAEVIDATGQFLIPGLWDMHVHMFNDGWDTESVLNLFLANGVTGVRDLGSNLERILALRQQIRSGSVLGPRMVVSGPAIVGSPTPEEARARVRLLKEAGVDTIKLYSYLSPPAFFAAIDEAKKQGLPAVGHVPFSVDASEAAKAGLKSIEHLEGVVIDSTDRADAFREEISERIREGKQGVEVPQIEVDQTERYRDSFSAERLRQLSAQFVRYQTWHCATLISPESAGHLADAVQDGFASYPYLRYVSPAREASWRRQLSSMFSADQVPNIKIYAAYKRVLTAAMHRDGVAFLAGTDAPAPGQVPGFSLHDELALLVAVGFSPLEALRTATLNPARFLAMENELGKVERGGLADLVLLEANPLEDIDNARRISAVIANGKLLAKDALQAMLLEVEASAGAGQ